MDTKEDIQNAAKEFLSMGVKNIIITLGAKGVYFENKEENYFIDALSLKHEVIDTTGAGDAFNGALAVALAKDSNYKDAIIFANKVGGISTTRLGAASSMPLLKEVAEY
ncbi:PfkB family carbohydrate kinase [Candidatus Pelagibacter sp.]|nr:PfkB family carbohydrate kinase [Candidatus Pelagibacter sp.]